MEIILQPWPWFVGGPLIALTLFLYFYFGKNFGASTNFETLCTIAGAGRVSSYFKKDWKERVNADIIKLANFCNQPPGDHDNQ
jgi:hypothetical protein